jgi:uncharacterized alkaline shock family protein YloU
MLDFTLRKERRKMTAAEEQGKLEVIEQEQDSVRISPDVIASIAGLAATEVEGIADMSGGIVGGIAEKLGRKDLSKGIKVNLDGEVVKIEINIIVEFGVQIAEVARKLSQVVRAAVEKSTGLKVASVSVNVLGLNIPKEQEEKSPALQE